MNRFCPCFSKCYLGSAISKCYRKNSHFETSNFLVSKTKKKAIPFGMTFLFWLRRQDSNLRPPGYELLKVVFSVAAVAIFALFCAKTGGHKSTEICPVHCVLIPYGSKHGSIKANTLSAGKQNALASPWFRGCIIHFESCKSFLYEKHHHQAAHSDAA